MRMMVYEGDPHKLLKLLRRNHKHVLAVIVIIDAPPPAMGALKRHYRLRELELVPKP